MSLSDRLDDGGSSRKERRPTIATTALHYEAHAINESYEDAYFYEPGAYMAHLVQLIKNRMQLPSTISNNKNNTNNKNDTILSSCVRRRILDIGGGTGNFARALIESIEDPTKTTTTTSSSTTSSLPLLPVEIIVVDPFLDPTNTMNTSSSHCYEQHPVPATENASLLLLPSPLRFVKASAEDFLEEPTTTRTDETSSPSSSSSFSWWRQAGSYHQILMKEMVHHLDAKDRVDIFRAMYQGLAQWPTTTTPVDDNNNQSSSNDDGNDDDDKTPVPSLLIVTRPQVEIDYPLWDEARQVWKDNQPSVDELVQDLQTAGFRDICHTLESYPCRISLQRWQSMVQNRFWSTFTNFSDDELKSACDQIASDYQDRIDDEGSIHFEDRLVFLTAYK
ncbi:hypothetical protein IV203_025640 [Nitzschia inconspicua]|uniref:S-adenosyl-L-methionine-dependent methyltransferase n=1 Tax=Nitzschia inconspicua TaxID=303405 RepID=A0A9K3LHW1_9STRA|nr:hypothetical protein IV203_025640 [Nitzschia inconspicua]